MFTYLFQGFCKINVFLVCQRGPSSLLEAEVRNFPFLFESCSIQYLFPHCKSSDPTSIFIFQQFSFGPHVEAFSVLFWFWFCFFNWCKRLWPNLTFISAIITKKAHSLMKNRRGSLDKKRDQFNFNFCLTICKCTILCSYVVKLMQEVKREKHLFLLLQ